MAQQELKTLVANGLQALKAGGQVAQKATADIANDVSHPELKAALHTGNQVSEQWTQRIQQAIQEAGPAQDDGNPVMEAHFEVSKRIRAKMPDATTRDLGIIAAGQLALHYWIAAFGTLANYAKAAGLTQTQHSMKQCADEAKQADEQHTQLAEKILQAA